MKKTIVAMLISMAIIGSISITLADSGYSVNLLGGVTFGMTANEVTFKLQQNNLRVSDGAGPQKGSIFVPLTEIGGFENTRAYFRFNILGQLDCVYYMLEWAEPETVSEEDFDILEETLLNKYGETDYCTQTGKTYQLNNRYTDDEWHFRSWTTSDGRYMYEKNTPIKYSERVVDYGDGTYMLVEHYLHAHGYNDDNIPEIRHTLAYTHYYDNLNQNESEGNADDQMTQEEKMMNAF